MAGKYVAEDSVGVITLARLQYFDINSATLNEEHKRWLLANVIPKLRGNGSVSLVGLASRSGRATTNDALSKRRAEAVKKFLEDTLMMNFPFDMIDGVGESYAASLGQVDGTEDGQFRGVMVYVHALPKPPDPKVIKNPPKIKPKPKKVSDIWIGLGESHSGDLVAVGAYNWNGRAYRASMNEDGTVDYVNLMADGWKLGGGLGGSVGAIAIVAHGVTDPNKFNNKGQWSDWDLDLAAYGKYGDLLKGVQGIGKILKTMDQYEDLSHAGIELTKNKGFLKKGLYTIPILGAGIGLHAWTGRKYGDVTVISRGRQKLSF